MDANLKKWKKSAEGKHILYHQEAKMGEMVIENGLARKSAIILQNSQTYKLKHSGLWKSNIEITAANGQVLLKSYYEKWYSKFATIEFENKKYKLVIRNNPLVEYAIFDGDSEILTYALEVFKAKASTRIQTSIHNNSYLLDFYLRYLFVSIAQENTVDDGMFLLLTTA